MTSQRPSGWLTAHFLAHLFTASLSTSCSAMSLSLQQFLTPPISLTLFLTHSATFCALCKYLPTRTYCLQYLTPEPEARCWIIGQPAEMQLTDCCVHISGCQSAPLQLWLLPECYGGSTPIRTRRERVYTEHAQRCCRCSWCTYLLS